MKDSHMLDRLPLPTPLRPVAEVMATQLSGVEALFERQLSSDLPSVNTLCRHIERYRGKMLRPSLTLLSGLAICPTHLDSVEREDPTGPPITSSHQLAPALPHDHLTHSHRVIACVCEMIHMATLVHDDVLDEASLRRQGATLNYLRGNEAAVLLGDYLISNAFHMCSTLGRPEINRRVGEVTNTLCSGELLQLHLRRDWSIDESTYFEIIERKTASLIGLCCELGVKESGGSDEMVEAMRFYGRKLGIAFQIQDDLLDLVGDESVVGKTLGQDLEKGKLTLPMILYLKQVTPDQRALMLNCLEQPPGEQRTQTVRRYIMESDVVAQAREVAGRLAAEAGQQLNHLPDTPVREVMRFLSEAVVNRRL